jgi:hypothetical protein
MHPPNNGNNEAEGIRTVGGATGMGVGKRTQNLLPHPVLKPK